MRLGINALLSRRTNCHSAIENGGENLTILASAPIPSRAFISDSILVVSSDRVKGHIGCSPGTVLFVVPVNSTITRAWSLGLDKLPRLNPVILTFSDSIWKSNSRLEARLAFSEIAKWTRVLLVAASTFIVLREAINRPIDTEIKESNTNVVRRENFNLTLMQAG